MTYGIDTDFLVAVEIIEHPFNSEADANNERDFKDLDGMEVVTFRSADA